MVHMVVGKACHGEVAMVIVWLISDVDALLLANGLGGFSEIFWQELLLLVKVVAGTLELGLDSAYGFRCILTTSIRMSIGSPFHFFSNSVASCSAPLLSQSFSPK